MSKKGGHSSSNTTAETKPPETSSGEKRKLETPATAVLKKLKVVDTLAKNLE